MLMVQEERLRTTHVGIDAHKTQLTVAILPPGQDRPERLTVANNHRGYKKLVRKVKKFTPFHATACYEAGPCGYALQRALEALGLECLVIAPSRIEQAPGKRVKNDRIDAAHLAELGRNGKLSVVLPPTPASEGQRDLWRLCDDARQDLQRARQRLEAFLTRWGRVFTDGRRWTRKHQDWLQKQKFSNPHSQSVFEELARDVHIQRSRLEERTQRMLALTKEKGNEVLLRKVGYAQCFRGLAALASTALSLEVYDASVRFGRADALGAYLGLTPSEYSTGDREKRGAITRAGNHRVRRLLVEAATHYRGSKAPTRRMRECQRGQPAWIVRLALQTEKRLCRKANRMLARGKDPKTVRIAIARELARALWVALCAAEQGPDYVPGTRCAVG